MWIFEKISYIIGIIKEWLAERDRKEIERLQMKEKFEPYKDDLVKEKVRLITAKTKFYNAKAGMAKAKIGGR